MRTNAWQWRIHIPINWGVARRISSGRRGYADHEARDGEMSVRHLEYLFRPRSVAVIGASDRPQSVGATVIRNVLAGGFAGPVLPVNARRTTVAGRAAYANVASLPETPDLAVICTPPQTVPALIADLGARGSKAAIVLTAGLAQVTDARGNTLQQAMLEAAKPPCVPDPWAELCRALGAGMRTERKLCAHRGAARSCRLHFAIGCARHSSPRLGKIEKHWLLALHLHGRRCRCRFW